MKSTRRGFGRRALSFGLAIFAAITLTAVGFAAWVLSNNANVDAEGGIKTETVTDVSIKIDITNQVDNVLYDQIDEHGNGVGRQNIVFAPIAPPSSGEGSANHPANNGQIQNDGLGESEDLTFTVKGTVNNIDKIGVLRFNVRVPESLIAAAGLTRPTVEGGNWTYDPSKAFIQLPSYAMDMEGKPIPYIFGELSDPDDEGNVKYLYPQNSDTSILVVELTGDKLVWTKDVTWQNPGVLMEGATTGTTKACDAVLDGSVFNITPYVEGGVVIAGNLSFDWTVTFNWGARYLGMNPNFFYDVNERIVGVHDTLTATSSAPHKYTVESMNLVNYDLLLMQSVINGLNIEDYLAERTGSANETYVATGITLGASQSLEDYINDVANAATIKGSLEKLQQNIKTAIDNFGKTGLPKAPVYEFWVFADVK